MGPSGVSDEVVHLSLTELELVARVSASQFARHLESGTIVMNQTDKPYRLCFVGPMMGRTVGFVTTQAQIVSTLFREAGYSVIAVSASPSRYVRMLDIVSTLIRRSNRFDIMWLSVFGGPSFVVEDIASFLARLFRKRICMFLHGGAMPQFMARHPKWTRRVLSRADVLIAPSPYLRDAISPYGFQARVVPNIINLKKYTYRCRQELRPRLFWMRSFEYAYNPAMAVRVLARLRVNHPEATLVMGGQEKGLGREVRALAASLGVLEQIRFAGFLTPTEKQAEGNAADFFINTNHIDNMPVAVVEACAMGLPVVATAVGGIPKLLTDGETGLLVPDDDDQAMVEAIERLLADASLAERLSVNGRKLAERSSWDQVRPQWEQIFGELMSEKVNSGVDEYRRSEAI